MTNNNNIVPGIIYTDGRKKDSNERVYLLLMKGELKSNNNIDVRDFEFIVGRENVYNYIKDLLLSEDDEDSDFIANIHESEIISESSSIVDGITFYEFMKHFKDIVDPEGDFDIEEYNVDGVILDE